MGGGGFGSNNYDDNNNNHHQLAPLPVPPPLSGQKRGFSFPGRGGSPGSPCSLYLFIYLFLCLTVIVTVGLTVKFELNVAYCVYLVLV